MAEVIDFDSGNSEFPKYPHLESLDHVSFVLGAERLRISEKIHGFNARFGLTLSGNRTVGLRNTVITGGSPFYDWAKSQLDKTDLLGIIIYGEWAGKGVQKGIDYGPQHFFLFDVWDSLEERFFTGDELKFIADAMECVLAPILYDGPSKDVTMAMLDEWRDGESLIAKGQTREGIVIHPEPPVRDKYGRYVIAKYKNAAFAERAHEKRQARAPVDLGNVTAFVEEYATTTRLDHVLQYLAEFGIDGLDIRNTGDLLRAMYNDVVLEGAVDYERLSSSDQKQVGKVLSDATKVLVEAMRRQALSEMVA